MTKRPKRPSMVDVAREAGVAHVTVSRVLNDESSVRPETRERVQKAIAKLGYRRNDLARALKSGNSRTIGVVIAGSQLFELPRVLHGVESAAQDAGYAVSLASWQGGDADRLSRAIDRLIDQSVEGIAIIADRPVAAAELERIVARVPMSVVMSGDLDNIGVNSIELDQRLGARLVVDHLADLGHREIVHLTGRLSVYDAQARLAGWEAAMDARGIEVRSSVEGDFTAKSGFDIAAQLIEESRLPSALFTGNDQMAMGVLAACARSGVRVPHDVSVVGFDDLPGTAYLVPALTTVRQDFFALGSTSIARLVASIDGARARHHFIRPELRVRASSAAPRPHGFP